MNAEAKKNSIAKGPALFFLSSLCVGGSEKKVVRLTNALYRRGHTVHVAYLNGPKTLLSEIDPGLPVVCLDRAGKFSLTAMMKLRSYVLQHDISQIICVNLYPLLYAMPLMAMGRRKGLSCAALVNTTDFMSAKERREMILYSLLLRRVDRVVFGCAFQMEQWIRQYRLLPERCGYIYNGVDEAHYSAAALKVSRGKIRASMGLLDGDFVVGTVGQLRPEKQHRDLVEAVSLMRQNGKRIKAIIAGGGIERENIEKLIHERGLEGSVLLLGEMNDVRTALAAMDVFALTSVAVETFSNAALEAMSMGRPAVVSDIAGAREMVWDGVNGYLFPKGNVDALVAALDRLAEDVGLLQMLGEKARDFVTEKFSFSRMVDQYEVLLPST